MQFQMLNCFCFSLALFNFELTNPHACTDSIQIPHSANYDLTGCCTLPRADLIQSSGPPWDLIKHVPPGGVSLGGGGSWNSPPERMAQTRLNFLFTTKIVFPKTFKVHDLTGRPFFPIDTHLSWAKKVMLTPPPKKETYQFHHTSTANLRKTTTKRRRHM